MVSSSVVVLLLAWAYIIKTLLKTQEEKTKKWHLIAGLPTKAPGRLASTCLPPDPRGYARIGERERWLTTIRRT